MHSPRPSRGLGLSNRWPCKSQQKLASRGNPAFLFLLQAFGPLDHLAGLVQRVRPLLVWKDPNGPREARQAQDLVAHFAV
jgi:hypothetical protein